MKEPITGRDIFVIGTLCACLGALLSWGLFYRWGSTPQAKPFDAPAWAQAILTVFTFAIALVAQRKSQKAAEAKQDAIREAAEMKEDALRAEAANREAEIRSQARIDKNRSDALSALAAAIPLKTRLLDALSIAQVLAIDGAIKSFSETFKNSDRLLDLRLGAGEAARLLDASKPVLRAIHASEMLWNHLEVRKDMGEPSNVDAYYTTLLAKELEMRSVNGINAVDSILYPPDGT